ncbi:MAG: hypothetical protein U0930_19005 [Pirellulales bacterium]
MDARLLNPLLGVAIATSLSFAFNTRTVQAQYYPSVQMVAPQPMVVMPQPMAMLPQPAPMRGLAPGANQGFPSKAYGASAQPAAWPAPSLPSTDAQPTVIPASAPVSNGQGVAHSENFIVFARDQAWANQVSETAERLRKELAMHWLGTDLPPWSARCPLHVHDGAALGASGETRFLVSSGMAGDWMMTVQGTRERILDSVLPHEISHTIFASHFGKLNKYVPRWADEGAATTVEHEAEKKKHRYYLKKFLQSGRGLAFNKMFQLKEYPNDILPLYAQGHSAVQFLIDQSGPQQFVRFLETGMRSEQWQQALAKHYDYASIWDFQRDWNKWLLDGSPSDLSAYAPKLRRIGGASVVAASANIGMNSNASSDNSNLTSNGKLPSDPRSLELMPSHQQSDVVIAQANAAVFNRQPEAYVNSSASGETVLAVPFDPVASTANSGNEGWFKTRLRQTSGQSATPIPSHNNIPLSSSVAAAGVPAGRHPIADSSRNDMVALNPTTGLRSSRPNGAMQAAPAAGFQSSGVSTARQSGTQSPSVQVLDWGPNERVSGGPTATTIR